MKPEEAPAAEEQRRNNRLVPFIMQFLMITTVLGCGIALATYYLKTGPEAKPRKRAPNLPMVEVMPIEYGSHSLTIESMGTINAATEISLSPGVGGKIISLSDSFVPGGFFTAGDLLVALDQKDYELAVHQLQAEVAKVKNELELEMGNQRIAGKEFEILNQKVSDAERRLMLRQPQLETRKSTLRAVEARLTQAELDLQRTKVKAPFNGVVVSRSVNLGSRVSIATVLARLVGTDEFWLKLAVPVEHLQWITFPGDDKSIGARVRVFPRDRGDDGFRVGRVLRLAPDLETQGRMASVYIAVNDPLCLLPENSDKPRLLLGSFVRAEIEGTELSPVVAIKRKYLRENETVWLMDGAGNLEIRSVDIVARTRQQIFIAGGIESGEKLIISDLSAPIPGSPLKLSGKGQKGEGPDSGDKRKSSLRAEADQ
jgi:RND family efflux transporter MFP subunit